MSSDARVPEVSSREMEMIQSVLRIRTRDEKRGIAPAPHS